MNRSLPLMVATVLTWSACGSDQSSIERSVSIRTLHALALDESVIAVSQATVCGGWFTLEPDESTSDILEGIMSRVASTAAISSSVSDEEAELVAQTDPDDFEDYVREVCPERVDAAFSLAAWQSFFNGIDPDGRITLCDRFLANHRAAYETWMDAVRDDPEVFWRDVALEFTDYRTFMTAEC